MVQAVYESDTVKLKNMIVEGFHLIHSKNKTVLFYTTVVWPKSVA